MTIKWNKITEVLPVEGKDYLVWSGHYMFVSTADFYHEEDLLQSGASAGMVSRYKNIKGYFSEFGNKSYFDDPKVYWAELPPPPGVKK